MATTYNLTGSSPTADVIPMQGVLGVYLMSKQVDLSGYTMVANDVYQVLPIPADTLVMQVKIEIVVAGSGTLTFSLGDGGSTAGWLAGFNVTGSAGTFDTSQLGVDTRAVIADLGYFYDAADSIDILVASASSTPVAGTVRVYALCANYNAGL